MNAKKNLKGRKMFECSSCDLSVMRSNNPQLVDIPASVPTVLFIGEPLYGDDQANLTSGSSLGYLIESAKSVGINFGENAAYLSAPRCHVPQRTDAALVSRCARKCHKLHLDTVTKELGINIVVIVGAKAAAYMQRAVVSECKANKFTHSYRSIVPDRVYFYVEDGEFIYEKLEEKDHAPLEEFIMTLKHIKMTADIGIKRTPVDYQFIDTLDKAMEVYATLKSKKELAVDIETSGLNKFSDKAKILTISFTWEEYQAVCFPVEHEESPFNQEEQQVIKELLNDVLSDPNIDELVFHNGKFDAGYMEQRGINTLNFNYDTMLAHYTLDETRGTHGLKKLALVYTDLGDYDSGLHQFMANAKLDLTDGYSKVPLEILWQYNCCDTDATLRLKHIFEKKMQVEGSEPLFRYLMKLSEAFTTIEKAGFMLDDNLLAKLEAEMPIQIDELENKFFSFSEVIETQRRLQKDEIDKCLREDVERLAKSKSGRTKPKKPEIIHFNPASVNHMRALLFDTLKLQNVLPIDTISEYLTKKGQGEVDDDLIVHTDDIPTEFLSTGKKTLNFINDLEHNEVVSTLLEHRSIKKLYGTYIKPVRAEWKSSDGLVHSTNLIHGTSSGRLASVSPNLQNCPRGSVIKQLFISRWKDGHFGQLDYSQVELRVAAMLSGDPKLIEAYKSGVDIHKQTAALVFGIHISEVSKDQRQYAKCLTGDTRILTDSGYKRLDEIVPKINNGKHTYYDGDVKAISRYGEPQAIESTYYEEDQEVYEIEFEDGTVVKADATHQWIVTLENGEEKIVSTLELVVGDDLPVMKIQDYAEGKCND